MNTSLDRICALADRVVEIVAALLFFGLMYFMATA